MTTGILNVKDLTIYKDVSGTLTALACVQNASIKVSNNLREIVCKDVGEWKEYLPGLKEWTASILGLFAFDSAPGTGGMDLLAELITGTKITIRMQTDQAGDKYLEGSAFIKEFGLDSQGNDDNVTYTSELQGSGALTIGTLA